MENKARHERDFKGVWIPREVWLSDELSLMEKVLFVEISSLDNERGCFASNQYFATFFGVSDRQIRTVIGSLPFDFTVIERESGPNPSLASAGAG